MQYLSKRAVNNIKQGLGAALMNMYQSKNKMFFKFSLAWSSDISKNKTKMQNSIKPFMHEL